MIHVHLSKFENLRDVLPVVEIKCGGFFTLHGCIMKYINIMISLFLNFFRLTKVIQDISKVLKDNSIITLSQVLQDFEFYSRVLGNMQNGTTSGTYVLYFSFKSLENKRELFLT